jgi:DNA-binding transcriptional LysR family regulator
MPSMDWDDLRYFLAVKRHGTLARAARALRINATTVGRRLAALEERVGARLFDRTPDGFVATEAGHALLPSAERMEEEALAVERRVFGSDQRLAGPIRLSTTEMIGTRFVTPHLPRFIASNPDIRVELSCSNLPVHLGRREADVALRLAKPREDNLVVKRLAQVDLSLYVARSYAEAHGRPNGGDLSGQRVILFADSRAFAIENEWIEKRLGSGRVVLRADSVSSIVSAAVAGLGVALLPRVVADTDPRLVRLDTEDAPEPRIIWQAVHRDLARSPRLRRLLDFLAEVFEA